MRRLVRWSVTVAVVVAAGGLLGGWFGTLMVRFSYDYIVDPSWWADLGLRLGLVAGTALGAAQVVGARPMPSWRLLAGSIVLLGAVSCLAILAGKEAAALLYARDLVLDTSGWTMPNAHRHAEVVGIRVGAWAGPILGTLAAAHVLWHARRRTPASAPPPPWT